MNRKGKILALFSICFLLIAGIFAQTSFLASTIPIANDSADDNSITDPTSSDAANIYDLPDGASTMDLNGVNNKTTTTLDDGGATQLPLVSEMDQGGNAAETVVNNSLEIVADDNNKTILKNKDNDFNATIDNAFNPHSVDNIQAFNTPVGVNSDISASAEVSPDDENWLGNFAISENGDDTWSVNYDWSFASDEETLSINESMLIVKLWDRILINIGMDWYNVSMLTGNVDYSPDGTLWGATGFNIYANPEFLFIGTDNVSIALQNETIIITDAHTWIVVIAMYLWDITIISILLTLSIFWAYLLSITIYWGYWVYIFYTYIVYALLFVFIYLDYDWKIEYYVTYIVIVWYYIEISIFLINIYIHWVIIFWWSWWFIKIQWWYMSFLWFIDYNIWIEYRWLTSTLIYIFYVPTYILPNMLDVDIIESIYTNESFYITILVTDCWGNPMVGAALDIWWDAVNIPLWDDNVDGTYNFTLNAILIAPTDPPITLDITAD